MKFFKTFALCTFALCMSIIMIGCGCGAQTITLGIYDEGDETFKPLPANAGYSLVINENNLILKGKIPYNELGFSAPEVPAGNIVAIQFKPTTALSDEDDPIVKTKAQGETDWTTETGLEEDKSFVWIVKIDALTDKNYIKIQWTEDSDAITYTLKLDENATLETEPETEP